MQKQSFTKRRVIITPNNSPSLNIFSASNFPNIQFVLSNQNGMLDPRTLRLNYKLNIVKGTIRVANNPVLVPSATNGISFNNRAGSLSTINQVNVSSMNGRNIETLQNFNRYISTFTPNTENQFDLINTLSTGDPFVSSKSVCACRQANVPTTHSVPLKTGFLSGSTPINLSTKGFHGLNINIQLAQNANAVGPFTFFTDSITGVPVRNIVASSDTAYEYQLSDVFLSYDIYMPSDTIFNAMPSSGQFIFNSINSLTSTLIASDSTSTLRLGVKNVLSITHSLIPAIHQNNQKMDSLALPPLTTGATATSFGTYAPLNSIQYMRGGMLFPYNYILDSETQAQEGNPSAQISEPALHSCTLYEDGHHGMNPLTNTSPGINNIPQFAVNPSNIKGGVSLAQAPDANSDFILGIPCDSQKVGVDYSMSDYSFRIRSNINGTVPFQLFSFVRCRNVALYSPTGIEVVE
tara:strand:- start:3005 stop:4396 length:1392 start_codon:yes stop_codon:yes gene_type:complete